MIAEQLAVQRAADHVKATRKLAEAQAKAMIADALEEPQKALVESVRALQAAGGNKNMVSRAIADRNWHRVTALWVKASNG